MSGIMFPGFKTGFTKVKIITVSAFESRPIDRKHLTAITPDFTKGENINTLLAVFITEANCTSSQDNGIKTTRPNNKQYTLSKT